MSNSDDPNMWKVIQGLNGTLDANSPNEAVSHNGRTITDIRSKTDVFINYYSRVSRLNMSQSNQPTVQETTVQASSANKKMKGKGAAGFDKIPLSFLKSLGSLALRELLSIFTSSFSLAHCP